jgi:acyl-CoA synthetase (AMP-forming)/AMP-acid ligase II
LSRPHDELQDPRRVSFLDEFPMTSAGKIQKVKLRERARSQWSEARP